MGFVPGCGGFDRLLRDVGMCSLAFLCLCAAGGEQHVWDRERDGMGGEEEGIK